MIEVRTIKVSLPLKTKFKVTGGEADKKTNLIAILNNRYTGEAAASVKGGPSIESLEADLRKGIGFLKHRKKLDMKALEAINGYDISPIARSALMTMVLNFISGETGRYPWEIMDLGSPVGIRNSITISISDPDSVIAAINSSDYPIIKIKMGSDHDAELVSRLGEISGKELRVDANGGWSCEQAEEISAIAYDTAGTEILNDTAMVHYLWKRLLTDNDEASMERDIKSIYVRNTDSLLELRAETYGDWVYYNSRLEGIDLVLFFDTDTDPVTGRKIVNDPSGGTIPINDIGAEYRVIIGFHGNDLDSWSGSEWVSQGEVDYLNITDSTNFFEVGIDLSSMVYPITLDMVFANFNWEVYEYDWAPNQGQGHVTYKISTPLTAPRSTSQYRSSKKITHETLNNPFD